MSPRVLFASFQDDVAFSDTQEEGRISFAATLDELDFPPQECYMIEYVPTTGYFFIPRYASKYHKYTLFEAMCVAAKAGLITEADYDFYMELLYKVSQGWWMHEGVRVDLMNAQDRAPGECPNVMQWIDHYGRAETIMPDDMRNNVPLHIIMRGLEEVDDFRLYNEEDDLLDPQMEIEMGELNRWMDEIDWEDPDSVTTDVTEVWI